MKEKMKKYGIRSCVLVAGIAVLLIAAIAVVKHWGKNEEIVILYTNDVHTYIDNDRQEGNENGLTYSKLAAFKKSFDNVLLADAGDHIQGTAYGEMDEGVTITGLMNATGYDVATLGNHEFDYGMFGCLAAVDRAEFPYLSCNFRHEENGVKTDTVLPSYQVFKIGGRRIAFVGITTPESFTSSTPAYFQDENGNYIYGISGGNDGEELYAEVQRAIDEAGREADYVIALGHLGVDPSSVPYTSREVIAHTKGLDAFIDGHSHTTLEQELLYDCDGNGVVLTQTGSYLNAIGQMVIAEDGSISCKLLDGEDLADVEPDAEVRAIEDAWIDEMEEKLGQVIGYAEVTLDNFDAEGNRLVRRQSTNSGDFCADALYYLFDEMGMEVDVAIMNGGGIRNGAVTGELTYRTCKEIHTFGNVACLQLVTGQQLLDALEWSVRELTPDGIAESGSFLHPSGMIYTVDLNVPSTVQMDDKGICTGSPLGEYRVKEVKIFNKESGQYEPLDLTATYHLAGYNYTLRDLGDGFAMFEDAVNVLDYVAEDYLVLANYIQSFPVNEATGLATISEDSGYAEITGSGRITFVPASR